MSTTYTRRKIAALLGVSPAMLALGSGSIGAQNSNEPGVLDVAILGAGAAGLTAGFLLKEAGLNFRVFEAASIHGGRAKKDTTFADFPLDLGGEWVHTSADILNTLSQTKTASQSTREWRPMTCHLWDGKNLHQADRYAHEWRGEQRFIDTTWFDFFDWYMARGIRDKITLNAQAKTVDYSEAFVRIGFADGSTVRARHVIVTVPVNVLKRGDIAFTPDLPRKKKRVLNQVIMPDGFKLFMRMNERFYPDMVLFDHGYETPESEFMFYNVSLDKPTRQNILGLFAHGELATPYAQLDERTLVQAALDQLDLLYDGAASRTYQSHVLQNWSNSPFQGGTYSYFGSGSPRTLGASIDGRVHFAGEAYNQRWDGEWGYMHVAARSAYDVVAEIVS